MTGEDYTITEVRHAWTGGHKFWTVYFTKMDGTEWCLHVQGSDELAAYAEAIRKIEGVS